uniref:Uncharacterized protein n=1 Tax=Nelumbo nucifera TaxID=4432 RepID=A0A822Z6H7_NELNU|nr:TPA_asm: hypothetical protein HUJ06_014985 [Nelumbo nucifera]
MGLQFCLVLYKAHDSKSIHVGQFDFTFQELRELCLPISTGFISTMNFDFSAVITDFLFSFSYAGTEKDEYVVLYFWI